MTMITPSYLGETIEYSSLHACRSTLEDPTELACVSAVPCPERTRDTGNVVDHSQPTSEASDQGRLVVSPGAALDPMVALATNVHASPGVYALLLGSGVSTAAGIPTGWQVVTDLVRKAATALAPGDVDALSAATADPDTWWSENGDGSVFGYSALLNALAPTSAARQALLASYFEPTEADREEGRKVPSTAHRAVAQLVARGSVRVILTTNFDRLIERALEEIGVPPQVLHRPEQLAGATPLAHARVTVIKLHGDYADLDQRNTADELAEYPETLHTYLGRVLDEYGLIASGWSAEWDVALVHALEEAHSRRYPLFWSSYGKLGESARRLIAQHGAVSLPGLTADDLFGGLITRLEALDRLSDSPITGEIAVQRLKRALPDSTRRIELADLLKGEIQRLASRIADTSRHPLAGVPFAEQRATYEEESSISARMLAIGVFYGDEAQASLWKRSLHRLMSARRSFSGGFNPETEAMRHYPALLCLWAMGISAILAQREKLLPSFLLEPTWMPTTGAQVPQPAVQCLNPNRIVVADETAPGGNRWLYPQSRHIRAAGRDAVSQIDTDDDVYKRACDRLEFVASLVTMDVNASTPFPWVGEFILHDLPRYEDSDLEDLLEGGAFGGDSKRAKAAYDALTAWIVQYGRRW